MADKQYKAIFVKEATHRKVVVGASIADMTHDEFINHLLEKYEIKLETPKRVRKTG